MLCCSCFNINGIRQGRKDDVFIIFQTAAVHLYSPALWVRVYRTRRERRVWKGQLLFVPPLPPLYEYRLKTSARKEERITAGWEREREFCSLEQFSSIIILKSCIHIRSDEPITRYCRRGIVSLSLSLSMFDLYPCSSPYSSFHVVVDKLTAVLLHSQQSLYVY